MKKEFKDKLRRLKKEVDKLYNQDTCIVGSIDKKYIQAIPVLQIYHSKKNGSVCKGILDLNADMRKTIVCGNCKEEYDLE